MTLDERHRRILFAVVTEYIASGQAVSSRRIAKRYAIKLSPATVRSVLVELEDSELLRQPHTSAGRVPTDAGFRCFVDAMASGGDISNAHRTALIQRLQDLEPGADAVRETGQLLSRLTGTATIIARPPVAEAILDQLRFMRLSSGRTLAVLVARSGGVENRVVVTELDVDGHILERVNNYLADLVGGRTLRSVRDVLAVRIATERGQYQVLREQAQRMVQATVEGHVERARVVIEGQGTLFDRPEFGDAEKIRGYLNAFEEKQKLLELLEQTLLADGVQVFIGSETALDGVGDISVISSPYRRDGTSVGSFGIVGPTRMDYRKYIPLVGFAADVLSDILDGRLPGASRGS
ncbi:MAG: heat-inducible transcription repressor HrcA [Myxococcales bacterium]|jgi:heat-inducible transcriptional repressor|nr:heat-inducible transcription repressor HrcA [Myxococcales bacterium]